MTDIKLIHDYSDFASNCYAIISGENAVLIDAPFDADGILSEINGKKLCAILLTHGHVDHMSAAEELRKATGCKVFVSVDDKSMLTDSRHSLADYFSIPFCPCAEAQTFKDGDELEIAGMKFSVITTPGHTPGSVCFVHEDVIFTGDTLFNGSIGRDFGWSCYHGIIDSIGKLYALGKNYKILPGHGEASDLYDELMFSPYLQGLKAKLK